MELADLTRKHRISCVYVGKEMSLLTVKVGKYFHLFMLIKLIVGLALNELAGSQMQIQFG